MAKRLVIELTWLEARSLWHAAGNSCLHPDAMEALFPSKAERRAALRGYDKLGKAWVAAPDRGAR